MSEVALPRHSWVSRVGRRLVMRKDRWRVQGLCLLLALSCSYFVLLAYFAPPPDTQARQFIWLWLVSFLPYIAACVLILTTRAPEGRMQWVELGIILLGALVFRAQLIWLPPNLSRDSWRYLWDARVTLNGYSPYLYVPKAPQLLPLRDFVFDNSRFRDAPTLYPPGAQAFYLVSYLLAPSNLYVMKGLLIVCELISTVIIALLLKRKGLDPARCILYAWSPLPVVEFALQGHVDALTIVLMLLTILVAQHRHRGFFVLTGFLLAWATLTKLYPLLLLAVLWRPRDWVVPLTCGLTIVLAYIPYILLGHGQVFGFFGSYASEQSATNAGPVTLLMHTLSVWFRLNIIVTYVVDVLFVGGVALFVWYWRQRGRISVEGGILLLIGSAFLISTHVFPWYVAALLPWVALLAGSAWMDLSRWGSKEFVICAVLYFMCLSILSYLWSLALNWDWYYVLVYDVTLLGLIWAACWQLFYLRVQKKKEG